MVSEILTSEQLATIRGVTPQYIRKLARGGKIPCEVTYNEKRKPKYLFDPYAVLNDREQLKFIKDTMQNQGIIPLSIVTSSAPYDHFSEAEREEIAFWISIVEKWQGYRNSPKVEKKTEIDELFVASVKLEHPDLDISTDILYRRWKAYKEKSWKGLMDNRGKHRKGASKVTPEMMGAMLYYYLDEAEHPLTRCYQYMKDSIKEFFPEQYDMIPSEATFRRHLLSDIPEPLRILGRKGEKAHRDNCGFYIEREYHTMASNEFLIGDTHTIDVQSQGKDGKLHRLYLSAWMDARSAVMVGWHISTSPSSQTSILALRDAMIRRKAIPENIYVDNGREFLTFDFGGLGHRAKKPKNEPDRFDPPPILKRLGINMTNAIVKNARAKTIERRFLDFKNQISRLFSTFTGGNIMERPECLKARVKDGNVVIDEQLIEEVNEIIEYYFNYETYGGAVKADHGKRKIDVYSEHYTEGRWASVEELNLMLMRSTRAQKVGRNGVHINVNGERFRYMSVDLKDAMFNQKAYCRYDPNDLSTVRVYDLEDRFVMEVPCADKMVLDYKVGSEEIKEAHKFIRSAERRDKDKLREIRSLGFKTARELVLARAMENKNNPAPDPNPKVVELHRAMEEPLYKQAVGSIDLGLMNKNAQRRQEEQGGNGYE